MAYNVLKGSVQFINSDSGSIESMVDDHSNQTIDGVKTFSQIITASLGVSSSAYYGDGSGLSGLTPVGVEIYNSFGDNRVLTSVDNITIQGEANLIFDGSLLTVTGAISASSTVSGSGFYGAATGLTSIPTNQFDGNISAADLNLGDSTDNSGGNLIVKLSSSGGLESTANGLRVNTSLAVEKTSPVDADKFVISDSAAGNQTKYLTYQNLAAAATSGITTYPPNGNDGTVQIKNGSAFQGPTELSFDTATNTLTVTGQLTSSVHISSSQIYATSFQGDGTQITSVQKIGVSPPYTASFDVSQQSNIVTVNTSGSSHITASLKAASVYESGARLVFKDVAGSASVNNIVIEPSGSETIDGSNTGIKIQSNYGAITIASNGTNQFFILGVN